MEVVDLGLKGITLSRIELYKATMDCNVWKSWGDTIVFHTDKGTKYGMFHDRDCCEDVNIEDIIGDLNDLIGTPILQSEVVIEDADPPVSYETATWSFYKLSTIKGSVTIRWYGSSGGYSETVTFEEIDHDSYDNLRARCKLISTHL